MTIQKLYDAKIIRKRAYNICRYHKFESINDLRDHYSAHNTFIMLPKCGPASNRELIEICKLDLTEFADNNPLRDTISKLTPVQKQLINKIIVISTNNLSTRCRIKIVKYLNNNLTIEHLAERGLFSDSFEVLNIKTIGIHNAPELRTYISIIKQCLIEVSKYYNSEVCFFNLNNNFLIQSQFRNTTISKETIQSKSIFSFIDFLLNQDALFGGMHAYVFKNGFKLYQNQKILTVEEIQSIANISISKLSAAKIFCSKELYNRLEFTHLFNDDINKKYGIDIDANTIKVDKQTVELINKTNDTSFSKEFITFILSVYLHDKFSLVGDIDDVLRINYLYKRNTHSWHNFYLIRKNLVNEFNFTAFVNDINRRLNSKEKTTHTLNFKSYINQFLNNNTYLDEILPIAESIINKEFGLYLQKNDLLQFKSISYKPLYRYIRQALRKLGKLSTIDEIHQKILEEHPSYKTSNAAIRATLLKTKLFIKEEGSTNRYSLRSLEINPSKFRANTIRKLVETYLKQSDKPVHISIIKEHVSKYHPKVTRKNILTNLRLVEDGTFIFFEGPLVGLASKNLLYQKHNLPDMKKFERYTWEEHFEDLLQFIEKEKRLPWVKTNSTIEKNQYKWLRKQIVESKNGNLEAHKVKLIKEISDKYYKVSNSGKVKLFRRYDQLIEFININNRLPSATREEEFILYRFFNYRRRVFSKGKLHDVEKERYMEVLRAVDAVK